MKKKVHTDNCLYIGSAQNYFVRPPPSYFIYWDRRSPGTCRVAVVLAVPTGFVAVQEYVPASSEMEIGLYLLNEHFFNKDAWNLC